MLEVVGERATAGAGSAGAVGSLAGGGHRPIRRAGLSEPGRFRGEPVSGKSRDCEGCAVTWKQSGPGGVHSPATALNTIDAYDRILVHRGSQPARCELHGIRIVDQFPRRCPLAALNPLTTIGQLRELAFQSDDPCDAAELFDRVDVCGGCIDHNLSHRTVRRLRRELGLSR
jgi:hypothetical protein